MESVHKIIKIDKKDKWLLEKYSFWLDQNGYVVSEIKKRNEKRKKIFLHHLILPKKNGYVIDHKNRDILDNRRKNLRYATRIENCRNCSKYKNNTSGYRGVSWYKRYGCWTAKIQINKKYVLIGYFKNKKDAINAYRKKAKEVFKDFIGEL